MRRFGFFLMLALGVFYLVAPAFAVAYSEPSSLVGHEYGAVCPPRPAEPQSGATASEVDLVTVAQEIADSCYLGEQLAEVQHGDFQAVRVALGETLKTSIQGEPVVKIGNWESSPASSTVEFSGPAKASVEGDVQALHDDMWYLLGSLLAIGAAFILYLEIRPRG